MGVLFFNFIHLVLFYVYGCLACMYVYVPPGCLVPAGLVVDLFELESLNSCEPRYGCWESHPGPLEEQPGLFATESYLQTPILQGCSCCPSELTS